MKKALITGCAGFIGSTLTDRLLDDGYNIIGIDNFSDYYGKNIKMNNIKKALKNAKFKLIEDDILNIEQFPEVDYVFHLAAQAGVRSSWGKNFEVYTKSNIEATQKLLEYYKNRKLHKFVYSSSSSVYGDSILPMKEENAVKPVSPYGVTKLAAENLCYLYYKNYGVPTISLRYFTVYGPRQRPDMGIERFSNSIINQTNITIYGDGTQNRDFTYVDDVVSANLLASFSSCVGEVFNIGGGSKITVNKLIDNLEELIGKKAIRKYVEKQKGDVEDTWANISKAKKLLNWEPKVDLKDGLKKYIEYINVIRVN